MLGRSNLRHLKPAQTCRKASRPPSWRPPSPTYTWPRFQRPSRAGCGCKKGRCVKRLVCAFWIWDGLCIKGWGERDAAAWIWEGSSLSLNISFTHLHPVSTGFVSEEGTDAKEKLYRTHLVLFCPQATHFGVDTFVWYVHSIFSFLTWQYFGQNSTKPANVHTGEKYRKANIL